METKPHFRSVTDDKQIHEKIVDQIRSAIFEKRFLPGDKLPTERELAKQFNTSRVTVRSALLTLRNIGLLQIRHGKTGGAFVAYDMGEAELSKLLKDIILLKEINLKHVVEVRAIIEPQIACLAAVNAQEEDVENIWSTIHELERLFQTKSRFDFSDENFHRSLAVAAGNPLLSLFQASLFDILFRFINEIAWEKEHKENILKHHRQIAEQVAQRNPEGAQEAMILHLSDMQQILSRLPADKTVKWLRG